MHTLATPKLIVWMTILIILLSGVSAAAGNWIYPHWSEHQYAWVTPDEEALWDASTERWTALQNDDLVWSAERNAWTRDSAKLEWSNTLHTWVSFDGSYAWNDDLGVWVTTDGTHYWNDQAQAWLAIEQG